MTLYVADCRRCGAQRMSFDVYGVSVAIEAERNPDPYGTLWRRRLELACRCHECGGTSVFLLDTLARDEEELPKTTFEQNENPTTFGYSEVGAIPSKRAEPTPADTPEPAASFYKQGSTAMAHGLYDAAGAMFRKCLESVTRTDDLVQKVPEAERAAFRSSWLKARIKKLKDIHAIPPALADLVDVIKEEGDGAVHDDVIYDKKSAEALQGFTKAFLEQTFTIPAQIKRVRERRGA